MEVTDAILVEKVRNGDQDAFSELYDKYAALVRMISQQSEFDPLAAQDLTQEVFIRAYTKLDKLQDNSKFASWLCSIARNVGREYRRSKARDRHVSFGTDAPEVEDISIDKTDQFVALRNAMSKLSEDERMALDIHYLQEKEANNEKGYEILEMSRSSYYRLVEKAKEHLSKLLENE